MDGDSQVWLTLDVRDKQREIRETRERPEARQSLMMKSERA